MLVLVGRPLDRPVFRLRRDKIPLPIVGDERIDGQLSLTPLLEGDFVLVEQFLQEGQGDLEFGCSLLCRHCNYPTARSCRLLGLAQAKTSEEALHPDKSIMLVGPQSP